MAKIRVGDESEIPNSDSSLPPQFDWRVFYGFRNEVIRTLRRYGSAGPSGIADIAGDDEYAPNFEQETVDDPDFFVVEDMYNAYDKFSIVECDPKLVTAKVITALCEMASGFPGWFVVLNLGDSGLRIFGDRVLLGGRRFWNCKSIAGIAARCRKPVAHDPNEPIPEEMYPLWAAIVSGEFRTASDFPEPASREWKRVLKDLEYQAKRQAPMPLNSWAYDRVRMDLNPRVKKHFARRFLEEFASFSRERISNAARNLQLDAGHALALRSDDEDRAALALAVSKAQQVAADLLPPKDFLFWWPYVLHHLGEPDEMLRPILIAELRALLTHRNPWIQLSAVFSLARLQIDDIAAVVDTAAVANPEWSKRPDLAAWLAGMRSRDANYPSLTWNNDNT